MLRLSTGHSDILQTDIAKGGETRPVCIENGKRGTMQKLRKIISALSAASVFTACAAAAGAASLNGYIDSFDSVIIQDGESKVNTVFGELTPIGNTAETAAAADLTQSAADNGEGIEQVSTPGLYAVKLGSSSNYGLGVYKNTATLSFNEQNAVTDSLYFSFDAYQYMNTGASNGENAVVKLTDTNGSEIFSYEFDIETGNVTDIKIGGVAANPSSSGNMNSNSYSDNTLAYLDKPIRVEFSYDGTDGTLKFSSSSVSKECKHTLSGITSVGEFTITDNSDDPGRMYTIDNLFAGTEKTPYAVSSVVKKGDRVYGNDAKAADTYVLTVTPYNNGTITSVEVDLDNSTIGEKSTTISGGSALFGIVVMDDADSDSEAYLNSINESSFGVTCEFK